MIKVHFLAVYIIHSEQFIFQSLPSPNLQQPAYCPVDDRLSEKNIVIKIPPEGGR